MRLRSKRRGTLGKHPDYAIEVRRSRIHGFGIFATQSFRPGDFIGIMSGIVHEEGDENCQYTVTWKDNSGCSYDLDTSWSSCLMIH